MAKSHLRLLSSSSESEDSGDEDQDGAPMNPRRGISDDSEDSEDEMDCNDEEEDEIFPDPGSDGDASCAICLNEFTKQKVGVPNNCRHIFCVDCILEWSKNANSCPVDRIEFEAIQVYRRFGGVFVHELVVEKKINVVETHENDTSCQVCGSGENEETLLLCDGCDLGYHCACLNPPLEQVPSDEWFCTNCRPSHTTEPHSRHHRVIGRTLASERVRSDITRSRLRHSALVSSLDEQIDSIVTEILSNSGHRLRISNSSARRPRSTSRRSTSRKKRTGSKKRRSTSKKRTSKRRKTKRGRKTKKTPRHPMSNRLFGGRCDNNAGNSTTNDITNGAFSVMGGADDLDEYMQSRSDDGDPSYITAQKHRMLSLSAIRFNVPLPSLLSTSSTRGMDRVNRPPPTPDLLGSILQSQEVLLAPTTNIQIQSGGKILLKPKRRTAPNELLPVPSGKEKLSKIPHTRQNGLSHTEKSGQASKSRKEKETSSSSRSSHSNKPSSSKFSSSRDRGSTSSETSNQKIEKSSHGSGEVKSEPPEDQDQDEKQKNKSDKKSSGAALKNRRILIRPVFNLPSGIQKSGSSSKDQSESQNVYDPFEPTEDDELSLHPHQEDLLYDPFQPTISDEEKEEKEKKDSRIKTKTKVKPEKRGPKESSIVIKEEPVFDLDVDAMLDDQLDAATDPLPPMKTPLKKEIKKEKVDVEEETMESPPAPPHPPPKVKKERNDAIELDMFAEMELERVENAPDVTRDEDDDLDSWRTNVPSSSDQVSLPGFSSSKETSGPPIKFKKLNRKIRNSFTKENNNQDDGEEKSVAESKEDQEKPEHEERQETQSGNTRNASTKDELKKKSSSGSRGKRSRSNSRSRVSRTRRSRSRSRNRRSSDARRRDSYVRRTSTSKYPRNRSRYSRSRSRSRDRKRRRSRSKDRSKDRKARSRSRSKRRSKSDLQSTSQPSTKESLEKKKEKRLEKRAGKKEDKSPEREKGKKSEEKSPKSDEKIQGFEIKKEPISRSAAIEELSDSRGKNKDDAKSDGVFVKQSSNVGNETEIKSKSKKRKIKEEVLSADDNLEETSERLKSEHDIAGSSQEKTKLENKDSNLVVKQDVKKKKKKKEDKEETGRPLKRKKSKHKDEEPVSDLSVETSKKKIKEEASSDHEKSHAKKHKKHKKHDSVKHSDVSPVKSHKSHKKKKKKSHHENDDFADMLLEDLEVTIKQDISDEKRKKSDSSSKEQEDLVQESETSRSSDDHRMLGSIKTVEKSKKLDIKNNFEESIDDMLEQSYFKQETTTESKFVEMNVMLDDEDARRDKSSDCDMRSPSPISPILLSPDQSPLPGANHSLLSNDLKETPSYAEEFLEQSRKRWNENLRKKSVSVTPEDLPEKEAGIESSTESQISTQKSDVKNTSNEVVLVKLDSDDHATVSDIFAESSGNVTPMYDSSQIAPENFSGEKTISIDLGKNFEISKHGKSDEKLDSESERKENTSGSKDKVEIKRKTPEKSKSRSKSDKKHESTSKRRRSSDHSSSKKQRSSRSPRRRSERSRKRSRDSDSRHKPRRRSSRSHSSPDHQRRSDKHRRSPSPVKRRDHNKNTYTYKTEPKVEKVEEPQAISTITSQNFEPFADNLATEHDSEIHNELLFSAPNTSALIQINTVDQPVLIEDISSKISTQQLLSNINTSSDKTSPKTLQNKVPVAVISPTKQEVKAPDLYSPSCPISPESPEPIGDLPPPPPPKINQSPAKVGVGVSKTSEVENEKKLNPTQILNIAGLNPTQQSAAKDAIMSIAELSRQLQLGQILPNKETSHKEKDGLSPVSIDNIESSAVEMYNKGKQKTLLKKLTFQQEVVEAAKSAIKPHYERREINKIQYKDIMKRSVNKICQADKTKIVNPVKVRRLIRRYVECYQRKNVKNKEKMKNVLDLKVEKHMRPKIFDPSESPPSPIGSPLTAPESASEDTSNTPSLLKREPRKIVTLPDLPLPPPPPPPRPRY